jgi:hypothetical protein
MNCTNKSNIFYDTSITIPSAVPFDGIEIHPVLSYRDGNLICFEICDPEMAESWSVYLHNMEGGVTCIADCIDRQSAQNFVSLLKIIVEHLNIRF